MLAVFSLLTCHPNSFPNVEQASHPGENPARPRRASSRCSPGLLPVIFNSEPSRILRWARVPGPTCGSAQGPRQGTSGTSV